MLVASDFVNLAPGDIPLAIFRLHFLDGLFKDFQSTQLLLGVKVPAILKLLEIQLRPQFQSPELIERCRGCFRSEMSVPVQNGVNRSGK